MGPPDHLTWPGAVSSSVQCHRSLVFKSRSFEGVRLQLSVWRAMWKANNKQSVFPTSTKMALAFHAPAPISVGRDFPRTSITVAHAVWSPSFLLQRHRIMCLLCFLPPSFFPCCWRLYTTCGPSVTSLACKFLLQVNDLACLKDKWHSWCL